MVSSTRSLGAGSLMLALLASPVAATSYSLVETWQGKNFLDYFNFHVGSDPTNGFVNYLDKETAESTGLVKVTDSGSVYLGVDYATKLDPKGKKGRDSVRIGSKKYYDQSLVIADIAHMPGSVCGTWPAFWSVGKNWPGDGEIDIIEGVNMQDYNKIVMHTAGTCSLTDTDMTGSVNATGCGEDLGTVGCVIEGHQGSYGTPFNKKNGGVYTLQWTDESLKIWYFPRSSIPASITSGKPDVTEFGTPMAVVQESCDVANAFKAQSFVFDTTFCGDWAGNVYGDSGCPMTGGDSVQSCHNYVANNPTQFAESYWEINSVKIYQTGVKGIASAPSSEPKPDTTAAAPVVSHTTAETHATHTATLATHATDTATAVHSTASTEDETAGAIQELTPTSVPTAAATAESPATEEVEHPATSKKTRTITSIVTATETVCPEDEKSSAIAAHSVATTAPAPVVQSVQISANGQDTEATTPAAGADPLSNHASVASGQSHAGYISATSQSFGASWAKPSAPPSAFVSSVPYEASNAPAPAPTDVPPSATSGSYNPSGSQSSFGPVFTGAADRLSISMSALLSWLIVAFLA
ncbi:Concanavalin A-like lectin/glucanases superfamily [Penicillium coprophilum]|uniref:Concanavalin A-like lectin/glucanases superfamily n=1 Tax=Penicillium coprophilum TaxID=36646 RepID=UPI00239B4739|nr:Concanavalin A-like lectin/glucanases superfamily [Penicillium coprophilum]KAJ5163964.1 Concanavalin A-like lectin/glucanases superfamily [Penicillium coprophilum]